MTRYTRPMTVKIDREHDAMVDRIMEQEGLKSRSEAVLWAIRNSDWNKPKSAPVAPPG